MNHVEEEQGRERGNNGVPMSAATDMNIDRRDCYEKIGITPTPEIDAGGALNGGSNPSELPRVRSIAHITEPENIDAADEERNATLYTPPESISELLFHAATGRDSCDMYDTIIDSGCIRTMWKNQDVFDQADNKRECDIEVRVGDGHPIRAKMVGDITLFGQDGKNVTTPNCFWVPDLKLNLITVPHLDQEGFITVFENSTGRISQEGQLVLSATLQDGLYRLPMPSSHSAHVAVGAHLLHNRLGHLAN